MDRTDIVKEVLEANFKTGVSAKNNKPWAMHKILTNGGITATTFDDCEPGDTVKLTYNEEYKNYNAAKPRKADIVNDEINRKLDLIIKLLENRSKPSQSGYEQAQAKAQELRKPEVTTEFGGFEPTDEAW